MAEIVNDPIAPIRQLAGELVISTVRLLDHLHKLGVERPANVEQLVEVAQRPPQVVMNEVKTVVKKTAEAQLALPMPRAERGKLSGQARSKRFNEMAMRVGPVIERTLELEKGNWARTAFRLNTQKIPTFYEGRAWADHSAQNLFKRYQTLKAKAIG